MYSHALIRRFLRALIQLCCKGEIFFTIRREAYLLAKYPMLNSMVPMSAISFLSLYSIHRIHLKHRLFTRAMHRTLYARWEQSLGRRIYSAAALTIILHCGYADGLVITAFTDTITPSQSILHLELREGKGYARQALCFLAIAAPAQHRLAAPQLKRSSAGILMLKSPNALISRCSRRIISRLATGAQT